MKVILPFDEAPESTTYHWIAFPLGVIKANIKDYFYWLSCKLINCVYRRDIAQYDFIEKDVWGVKQGLSETQTVDIIPQILSNDYINVISLLEFLIQEGYFITGEYNEFYIPQKSMFNRSDYLHDYIIWGYDNRKELFFTTGYLKNGDYRTFEIPYSNYYNSIVNTPSMRVKMWFHKINKKFNARLDISTISDQLESYISSTCRDEEHTANTIFGIDVWHYLESQLSNYHAPFIDLRQSRLIMEHKNIMFLRLNELQKNGYLKDNSLVEKYHCDVVEKAKLLHLLFIKYNLVHTQITINHALEVLRAVNIVEQCILIQVLKSLQQSLR